MWRRFLFMRLCSFTAVISIVLSTVFKHEFHISNKLLLRNILPIIDLPFNGGQVHRSLRLKAKQNSLLITGNYFPCCINYIYEIETSHIICTVIHLLHVIFDLSWVPWWYHGNWEHRIRPQVPRKAKHLYGFSRPQVLVEGDCKLWEITIAMQLQISLHSLKWPTFV